MQLSLLRSTSSERQQARHRKALAEGREDDCLETWGLFDAGGDARM
jgi:hypothetical protein